MEAEHRMSLTKEDLEPFIGKEVYSLQYEWSDGQTDEIDYGTILTVTNSAVHLDTSRKLQDFSLEAREKPEDERWYDAKLMLVIPLSRIHSIEVQMEVPAE